MAVLRLTDRTVIEVKGQDAETFLQNILTADLASLGHDEARACALLTPQGKIFFDFLISRVPDGGFLIDVAQSAADDLVKRLTLYKLRAKVEIAKLADLPVLAVWDETAATGLRDSRFGDAAVYRSYEPDAAATNTARSGDYDRLRIAHGVAESGRDFALSDAFPHDILMDLNGGVSFAKGCFVGQEVVSRMHHRKSARRRIAIVESDAALPGTGNSLEADGKPLGVLGTVAGNRGLALVRIDRVADALADGKAVTASGSTVTLGFPEWTGLSFEPLGAAAEA